MAFRRYVFVNVLLGCCCRRRLFYIVDSDMAVRQNGCACVLLRRSFGKSVDRIQDIGMAFHQNGCERALLNWPLAKRICCSRCNDMVFHRCGCANGSSECWGGHNFFLEQITLRLFNDNFYIFDKTDIYIW